MISGRPVTIQSYYRRVANQPRWDVYAPAIRLRPGREPGQPFVVPDGTRLVAVLDTPLSTRTSRSGERFSMTVLSPEEYRAPGSTVSSRGSRHTAQGRNADMQVDFDTIRVCRRPDRLTSTRSSTPCNTPAV